jgi:hypothetical protein
MRAGLGNAQVRSRAKPRFLGPFQSQWQRQFDAGRARLSFGERQLLGIFIDRRVVGAQRVDCAVCERCAQRVAVALA